MSNDTALTEEEFATLRAHGYKPVGGGNLNGDGVIWLKFRKDGEIVTAIRSAWRLTIAELQRPAIQENTGMIECPACHFQTSRSQDLADHIQGVHGFGPQAARLEAERVAQVKVPIRLATLQARLETLKEILTDPVNQLEQTKGGYYIYRFDLETMHQIADAIGIPRGDPVETFNCYTPEELPGLIRPD